jgi:hypothetical protein
MRGGRLLVGRLECIGKGQLRAAAHQPISWRLQWAHARDWARELAGCCGPARAHRQGQLIHIMGPCEGLGMRGGQLLVGRLECIGKGQLRAAAHQPISWRLQWAHARDWAREFSGCCGPARAHRQGQLMHIMGPCEGLGMRGGRLLVGRLECIGKGQLRAAAHQPISWRLQWAHARDWARELAGCCGPARAHRQGQLIHIMGPCEGLGMRGGRLLVGRLECIGKGQLRAAAH